MGFTDGTKKGRNASMNQTPPTQRPPVRTPRPAPSGPMRRPTPPRPAQPTPKYGKAFVALLATTVSLLLVSLIVLGVVLCVGGFSAPAPSGDGDSPSSNKGATTAPPPSTNGGSAIRQKTDIQLPCATSVGAPVSGDASEVQTIEGIASTYAVLLDMTSNQTLAVKNADARVYPASMTKIMTVLVACEQAKSPVALMTVTQKMLDDLKATGGASTIGGWTVGDSITVEDALYLVNYQSDTIACWLLADYVTNGGGEAAFVQLMNEKAQALGLQGTHFANSTGLHESDHYTTCRDMAAILRAAMNNASAKAVITRYSGYQITVYNNNVEVRTTTQYATWYSQRLGDDPNVGSGITVVGGKTGWETIPTSCFITVAYHKGTGKYYICVTVGKGESTGASVSSSESVSDAKHIYRTYAT